jgi:tRNA 2-thiouridine synthesizing protein D
MKLMRISECGITAWEESMSNVAMILKRSPYGDINAAEAVRHALGAVTFEMSVDLILMDSGVLLAKKGQDDTGTGFTNLEGTLKDCIEMGVAVYADDYSLKTQRIGLSDVVDGVKMVGGKEIAGLLKEAKATMIF